jgi:hypothetical protein
MTILDKPVQDEFSDFLCKITNKSDKELVDDTFLNEHLFAVSVQPHGLLIYQTTSLHKCFHNTSLIKNVVESFDKLLHTLRYKDIYSNCDLIMCCTIVLHED